MTRQAKTPKQRAQEQLGDAAKPLRIRSGVDQLKPTTSTGDNTA